MTRRILALFILLAGALCAAGCEKYINLQSDSDRTDGYYLAPYQEPKY